MQVTRLYKVGAIVPTLFLLLSMPITALSQSQSGTTLAGSLTAYLQRLPQTLKLAWQRNPLTRARKLRDGEGDEYPAEKSYRYQVATPALCDEMITMLKQNADTLCIARLLPKSISIAHKTGELTYVRGDAGIVYAKEPFLLSIFAEGVPTPEAERMIGDLALLCYTYFSR